MFECTPPIGERQLAGAAGHFKGHASFWDILCRHMQQRDLPVVDATNTAERVRMLKTPHRLTQRQRGVQLIDGKSHSLEKKNHMMHLFNVTHTPTQAGYIVGGCHQYTRTCAEPPPISHQTRAMSTKARPAEWLTTYILNLIYFYLSKWHRCNTCVSAYTAASPVARTKTNRFIRRSLIALVDKQY